MLRGNYDFLRDVGEDELEDLVDRSGTTIGT